MTSVRDKLLTALADGEFHSGARLAKELSVSRAAVWKNIELLRNLGLPVNSRHGLGYRLARPLDLLHGAAIQAQVNLRHPGLYGCLHRFDSIESTNAFLLQRSRQPLAQQEICLAEHQWGGRGRAGRSWHSPFGLNLYLSFSWRFQQPPASLMGLSLIAGLGVQRALQRVGLEGIGLKWPNDLQHQGRKLAGLLIEMHGESQGPCWVITGLGLNVNMEQAALDRIGQPATSMLQIRGSASDRNPLVVELLCALAEIYAEFSNRGLSDFIQEWAALDVLLGKKVTIQQGAKLVSGLARGIGDNGALLVEIDGQVTPVQSGEVSVRAT